MTFDGADLDPEEHSPGAEPRVEGTDGARSSARDRDVQPPERGEDEPAEVGANDHDAERAASDADTDPASIDDGMSPEPSNEDGEDARTEGAECTETESAECAETEGAECEGTDGEDTDEQARDYFVTLPVGPDVGLTEVVAAAQEVDRSQAAWNPGVSHSQVAAVLGAAAPGASLAHVLEQAMDQDSSDRDQATRIELIAACERMMAHLAGIQARFAGEFLDERGGSLGALTATHDEIAIRLAITSYAAGSIIGRASTLADSPRLREALAGGEVSARKVDVIAAAMSEVELRERLVIEEYGIELAPTHTPPQLKKALAAAVIAADPSKAKERHEKAVKERCVTFDPAADGMAWIGAYLPAEDALSIYTCLDGIAANHAADDERCIHARRADALTEIFTTMLAKGQMLDGTSLPTRHGQLPHLHLSITAPVLAGDEHTPALLHGYGPIDAGHARTLAERCGATPPTRETEQGGEAGESPFFRRTAPDAGGAGSPGSAVGSHGSAAGAPGAAAGSQGAAAGAPGAAAGAPGAASRTGSRSTSSSSATSTAHQPQEWGTTCAPRAGTEDPGSSNRPNLEGAIPGPCPVAPGVNVSLSAHPGATWSERCDLLDRLGPDATTAELDAILGPADPWTDHRSRAEDLEIWRQLERSSPPRSPGSPEEPETPTAVDGADPDDPDAEWAWMCRYLPRLDPMWELIPPARPAHLPDGTDAQVLVAWLRERRPGSDPHAEGSTTPPTARAVIENELGLVCTDAYAPSRRLRSRIIERDQTCRFPTCQVPAWRCQLDHIVAFDDSVPAWAQTVETNLHALCAHHHQIKTAGIFTVERDPRTGITTWHAPTGHVYARAPEHADYTAIAHHLRDDYAMTIVIDDPVPSAATAGVQPLTVPAGAGVNPDVHRWLPESTAPVDEQRARLAKAAPDTARQAGCADATPATGGATTGATTGAAATEADTGSGWPDEPPF